MLEFNRDTFDSEVAFTLEEAAGEVDGVHVLGKVKGPFFVLDGKSRNGRFYPRSLWEKQLSKRDVLDKIEERRMFGTIGHEQKMDDNAIAEGKVSHIITDLTIKEGKGFGEALILGTPYGQVLNTMLRAGAKLYVSSRAKGKFSGKEGDLPRVDPETYQLESFDFVMDPGFVEANPSLVEKLNDKIENIIDERDDQMTDQKLLESLSKENCSLRDDMKKAIDENLSYKTQNEILNEKVTNLEEKLKGWEDNVRELAAYKVLGEPEDIQEGFDKAEKLIKEYRELGTVQEIDTVLTEAENTITKYKELGEYDELKEALDRSLEMLAEYKELGSPSMVELALDKLGEAYSTYSELGTPEEVSEAFDKTMALLEQYKEIGTPDEINQVYDKIEDVMESIKVEKKEADVKSLSEKFGVSTENIEKVYESMTEEEMNDFFGSIKQSTNISEKYKKKDSEVGSLNENKGSKEVATPFNESLTKRLLKNFN